MLVMTYDKSQAAGKFSEAGFMFIVEISDELDNNIKYCQKASDKLK